jgi:hypothetical protein
MLPPNMNVHTLLRVALLPTTPPVIRLLAVWEAAHLLVKVGHTPLLKVSVGQINAD